MILIPAQPAKNRISIPGGGKNLKISMIRLLAMCLIIACHFCQYYNNEWAWWLNVGVQIFFIISGYLYGTKNIEEPIKWIKKQFLKILIPYWICLSLTLILYYFFSPNLLSIKSVIGAYFTFSTIKGIGHLWFISYILFCYLITPYLSCFRDYLYLSQYSIFRKILIICVLIIIGSLFCIIKNAPFRPGMICCYVIGYFAAAIQTMTKKNVVRVLLYASIIPCLLLNSIYCYFRYYNNALCANINGMDHLTDYSRLFLGLVITLFLMMVIKKVNETRILKFSDNNSYEIYLVHQIYILSPFTLLGVTEFPLINVAITLCAILLTGSLLHIITHKNQIPIHKNGVN